MGRDRSLKAAPLGAAAAAFCLALGAAAAQAQTALSDADRAFIEQAAQSGHAEVSMGESAAESENPAVSAFGKQMIADHGRMNDELAALAKRKGVEPPSSADLASQAKGAATAVLPGATFDEQYVSSQLDDHKETLALFQQEARSGQDPDLKALAEKGIPIIQGHIAELEELQRMPELQ
jgi:putative membrane protein